MILHVKPIYMYIYIHTHTHACIHTYIHTVHIDGELCEFFDDAKVGCDLVIDDKGKTITKVR